MQFYLLICFAGCAPDHRPTYLVRLRGGRWQQVRPATHRPARHLAAAAAIPPCTDLQSAYLIWRTSIAGSGQGERDWGLKTATSLCSNCTFTRNPAQQAMKWAVYRTVPPEHRCSARPAVIRWRPRRGRQQDCLSCLHRTTPPSDPAIAKRKVHPIRLQRNSSCSFRYFCSYLGSKPCT